MSSKTIRPISLMLLLAAGLWIAASFYSRYRLPTGMEAWMLDVGQGESVLVRDPIGTTLLFDGGPDDTVLSELGDILPPTQRRIDLVILSHNHSDHLRGLVAVLQRYTIGEIWISGARYTTGEYHQFIAELDREHIPTHVVYFNRTACSTICPAPTHLGQLILQVYHPLVNMEGTLPSDQHDATVSVKIHYGNQSLFMTGDLNEGHEQEMEAACSPPQCSLASTILQVPHHGSASGLEVAFLEAVSPMAALIPVGLGNKFGHPAPPTLAKLTEHRIPIYRTDLQGRIHLLLDGRSPPWIRVAHN